MNACGCDLQKPCCEHGTPIMSAVLFAYAEVTSRDFPLYEQAQRTALWADYEAKRRAYFQHIELESDSQA